MSDWSKRGPKPAGQGGVAPANVQPVNAWESSVSNTANADKDVVSNTAGVDPTAHIQTPGGYGGSR